MVSSCFLWWSFTCQDLAVNARNRAKITKLKSDVLETPVILMSDSKGWLLERPHSATKVQGFLLEMGGDSREVVNKMRSKRS